MYAAPSGRTFWRLKHGGHWIEFSASATCFGSIGPAGMTMVAPRRCMYPSLGAMLSL